MPHSLQLIHARDFMRTTATGHLDWEATKALFAASAKAALQLKGCDFLLDLREAASSDLSNTQIWHLVQLLREYDPVFREKIAILLSEDAPGDRARFFELCARNRGFRVGVFSDFEHAISWMMSATELPPTQ